jgi:hypothetical protein
MSNDVIRTHTELWDELVMYWKEYRRNMEEGSNIIITRTIPLLDCKDWGKLPNISFSKVAASPGSNRATWMKVRRFSTWTYFLDRKEYEWTIFLRVNVFLNELKVNPISFFLHLLIFVSFLRFLISYFLSQYHSFSTFSVYLLISFISYFKHSFFLIGC